MWIIFIYPCNRAFFGVGPSPVCRGAEPALRRCAELCKICFLAAACVSIGAVAFICIYMVLQGAPAIYQIGLKDFLFSTDWSPTAEQPSYGIAYMVLTSVSAQWEPSCLGFRSAC